MTFKQSHEMQSTLKECLRELTHAIGHLDYEVTGNQIIVRDHGRRLVIDLVYEGDRHLGSLDLPMTRVDYEFIGYTKEETDEFMDHLNLHIMRLGG
jgi:hypothetical protein